MIETCRDHHVAHRRGVSLPHIIRQKRNTNLFESAQHARAIHAEVDILSWISKTSVYTNQCLNATTWIWQHYVTVRAPAQFCTAGKNRYKFPTAKLPGTFSTRCHIHIKGRTSLVPFCKATKLRHLHYMRLSSHIWGLKYVRLACLSHQ